MAKKPKSWQDVGSAKVRHRVKTRIEQRARANAQPAAPTAPGWDLPRTTQGGQPAPIQSLQDAFPFAYSFKGSIAERDRSYWENPDKVIDWYNRSQADPNIQLPEGMNKDTLKGVYDYIKYQSKGIQNQNLWRLGENDPLRDYLKSIPAPSNNFLNESEVKIWGAPDPKTLEPGGTSQIDFKAPDFDWQRLTVEQKQAIVKNPDFSISQVTAPGQQGLILSDPTFDLWGKAKRGELPWWQPVAYSLLSNPKTSPAVQGAALTVLTGGKGLVFAVPMVLLGYGAQSQNETIRVTSETLLKPFIFGSQTTEQIAGLGQYLSAGSRRIGHAAYTPEELAIVQERTQTFLQNPKEVFGTMKVFYETAGGQDVWVLGENQKVEVRPGYTLNDAVKRVLNGESSDAVLTDYSREYGINGVASDFLLQSVLDPLNAAPEVISTVRAGRATKAAVRAAEGAAKLAETPGISSVEQIAKFEARARVETAKATVFESTAATTGLSLGSVGEAGRKFRSLIQSGAIRVEDAKYMTRWERAVAGITPDGKIRELLPKPLEGTKVLGVKIPKFIETMVTLQPKAKAKMFLERYHTTVAGLFDWAKMTDATPGEIIKVMKAAGDMDMVTLHDMGAEFMNNPEAYTTIGAVRDALPKLDDMKTTYDSATANRQLFWQVQGILGDPPKTLLKNFLDGDALPDFNRLIDAVRAADTPEARTLLAEIDSGNLTHEKLSKAFEPFRDGNVAIHPAEFSANVINFMEDHMKTWGKDYFDLKIDNVFDDSLRLLKGAQSLLLLDLSPGAMINDFVNERVMMATTGTFGLTPHKVIDAWIKDFGITPKDAGYGLLGDLPVKEGDVVSSLTKGKGVISNTADALNKGRSYLLRPQASARFNTAHARQIFYKSAKTFWSKQWRVGIGFDRMPAALEGRLREYGLDPNLVYRNMEGVLSTKQLETLNQRISTNNVNHYIDQAASQLGRDASAVTSMLEELGIADDLRSSLDRAKTPEARQAAFDLVEDKLLENFDQRQAAELQGLLEQTRNKIKTEGPAGVVQTFHDITMDYFERKIENDNIWDDAFARSEGVEDYGTRQRIKSEAARKNDAAWRRTQARQGALYTAAIEGLGLDTQFKRNFLGGLSEQHRFLRDFFTEKNRRVREFFDKQFDTPEARTLEWNNLELELNTKFGEVEGSVLKLQGEMNNHFAEEMARVYGDGARTTAKNWTDAVLKNSTDIHESITSFRDTLRGRSYSDRRAAWDQFKPEYRKMWMERMQTDLEGAGRLYKWDQLPPDAMQRPAPDVQRYASIEEIANRYGIPTATETGAPNNRRLLATVKKYLGAEAADVNNIRDLTPDTVERALEIRKQAKAAPEPIKYTPEEQARIDAMPKGYERFAETTIRNERTIKSYVGKLEVDGYILDGVNDVGYLYWKKGGKGQRVTLRDYQIKDLPQLTGEPPVKPVVEQRPTPRLDDFDKAYTEALGKRKYTTQQKALDDLNTELQRAWESLPDDADTVVVERLIEIQNRVAREIQVLKNDVSIAEGMTRARLEMDKSDAPLDTNEVQRNLKTIKDAAKAKEEPVGTVFPPGGYDEFTGYVDYGKVLLDGYNTEVKPVMDAMREAAGQAETSHNFIDMDADTQAQLNDWLKDTRNRMENTKHQAKAYGEANRDFALLDYNRQYGFDKPLSAGVPYEFFGTRSGANWITRVADKPAWISHYVRLQKLHNTFQSQLPERMRNKIFIPMPFLPEWAGGGMFIDPTYQLFPFRQFTSPLESLARDNAYITNNASYILRDMVDSGNITQSQYDQAIQNQSGPIWDRALEQAKIDQSDNRNGAADYFSMLLSPALYLTVPYYLATGKKLLGIQSGWPSGQLPITKFGQGLQTAFKDTPLEWIGNAAGLLAKPEAALRKTQNLNEFGEWGEYYIERQVANMVAEGRIDPREGQRALIEKKGDIWDQANERVRLELTLKVPGLAGLYGALHGATLDQAVGTSLASLFPGGLLPPGEMEYKGLKQEYGLAWEAYKNGNKEAFTKFFDDHPEYSARLALRRDPEERMTQFLKSEIWDAYGSLEPTNKKQAVAFMGPQFQDFLDADSGVDFSTEQLATWVKMLNGMVPQTEATQGVIEGQTPTIDYFAPQVTDVTDKYFNDRKEKFPNYYSLQSTYYGLPRSERARFLLNFPEFANYQKWQKQWYKDYPELKPVFNGEVFRRIDTSNWPPALKLMAEQAAYSGDRLPDGARSVLYQIWIQQDQPYGDFDNWVENNVYPSLINQQMQDIAQ